MLTGIDMLICTVLFVMSLLTAIIAHLNGDDSPAQVAAGAAVPAPAAALDRGTPGVI